MRTHLLVNNTGDTVIGFFSFSCSMILIMSNSLEKSLKYEGMHIYQDTDSELYPAIRLHQFAVDRQFHI